MKPKIRPAFLVVITLSALVIAVSTALAVPSQEKGLDREALTGSLEIRLFELVNKERTQRGLTPLGLSPELAELARSHSRDMAERLFLSHESTPGKPFDRRIDESRIPYEAAGENVVFSDSYVPDFIHGSLMNSPEHSQKILSVDYDKLGIGVVYVEKRGFYVTQHFARILVPVTEDDAEESLKKKINAAREAEGRRPLSFSPEAGALARRFSKNKASELSLPKVGDVFGETIVESFMTKSLDAEDLVTRYNQSPVFESAGLGVRFCRTSFHAGGVYFVTVFLFPKNSGLEKERTGWKNVLLETINTTRRDVRLSPFVLDLDLSREADKISNNPAIVEDRSSSGSMFWKYGEAVVRYQTANLADIPDFALVRLMTLTAGRIGFGVSPEKPFKSSRRIYGVTLIWE